MADISAKDVAALRKLTGAGMMDCKNALGENDGDIERAKDWLREKGKAGAAKREGRSADQGAVDVCLDGNIAALVELNCETDFVAKGDQFKATVAALAQLVAENSSDDVANLAFEGTTVVEHLTQMSATMGEKIELGRVARYVTDDGAIDAYKHIQSERGVIGVLVEIVGATNPGAAEIAHDVALHIAFARPKYLTRDEVPADVVAAERDTQEQITRNEGKPEAALTKIVEGRMGGYFKSLCLVEQEWAKDNKQTIKQMVGAGSITRFAQVEIG